MRHWRPKRVANKLGDRHRGVVIVQPNWVNGAAGNRNRNRLVFGFRLVEFRLVNGSINALVSR